MNEATPPAAPPPARRSAPAAAPIDPAIARALKCVECAQRAAVISNIEAKAYTRAEDLETDLKWLEAMPR